LLLFSVVKKIKDKPEKEIDFVKDMEKKHKKPLVKFKTLRNFIVVILIFVLGGVVGFRYGAAGVIPILNKTPVNLYQKPSGNITGNKQSPFKSVSFDTFWEAWRLLENDYLEQDKLNAAEMLDGAIRGMTSALGDPYTTYLSEADNKRSGEDLAGSFYGVGIELGYIDGTLAAVTPLKGSPAETAGIEAGDLILHVKDETKDLDEDTIGWTLLEAVDKIRGEYHVPVTLTVFRKDNGNEPIEIEIIRDEIVVESVELEFVEHNGKRVAHIMLSRFGERTNAEWNDSVNRILAEKNNISGVVLDMRNNPGGFFDTSIDIASDFIKKGIVVSQKSKYSQQDYKSRGKARLADFNTVVLVNKGSASASEIVAGALRDDLGLKLIGEQTFGKGTVQDRRELSNGGGMHITVGRWLLPKGAWIHDEGIPVDIEVKNDRETEEDEVLIRAIEEL
jgi:carboxyl-terminal processing protease